MTDHAGARLPGDGVEWSVLVEDDLGAVVLESGPDRAVPGASLGKVLLLVEVAERIVDGSLDPQRPYARTAGDEVADSGLWQLLVTDALPVADLAALVGAVSDNLATNVLLREVGLAAVTARGHRLGLRELALHDRVRDERAPADPPRLSTVTARELVALIGAVSGTRPAPGLSRAAAELVRGWLAAGSDLSMVASAFGLDPLAHREPDRGLLLVDKTGTDRGLRGETGTLTRTGTGRSVTYAAVATWDPDGVDRRDEVLSAMRGIGELVLAHLGA